MKDWLRGKPAGLVGFLMIAALVAGGLGWATAAALRLEEERLEQRADAMRAQLEHQAEVERGNLLRLALWRLDSGIFPLLAREDSRPFNHYSAVYAVPLALNNAAACLPAGTVMEPSPLLGAELPPWMRLHFQVDLSAGWESPQVLSQGLTGKLHNRRVRVPLTNVTPERQKLLRELARDFPAVRLLELARAHTQPATVHDTTLLLAAQNLDNNNNLNVQAAQAPGNPPEQQMNPQVSNQTYSRGQEYTTRLNVQEKMRNEGKAPQRLQKDLALNTVKANGSNWFAGPVLPGTPGAEVLVNLSPMVAVWLPAPSGCEHLVLFRLVNIEDTQICQGILLDAEALETMLADSVKDLFPEARLVPMRDPVPSQPERTMTALPFQLDPGPSAPAEEPVCPASPGWTPLRWGLALAWLAALVALSAVGLGGWSLLNLSERRIRFVSAVTHELRTPLTTLRLYLDMLQGGMVRDEKQRGEYIHTLHAEADRLNRLVGNVLDFSRLENQRPRLNHSQVRVAGLLEQVRATWAGRCHDADKELIVESDLGPDAALWTDGELLQQILGNLLDNACKYSRGAEDRRLWVRARRREGGLAFEVEDRGPGVPVQERRLIFRAFRRGRAADVTAGGVGLGLALARRWSRLLGGRLTLAGAPAGCGACFRVELPA
jgi:signal transduction histidine kinase